MPSKYRQYDADKRAIVVKMKLCREIIREARRCVELAGNPIRIIDPDTARTAPRRKHHIRA